MSRVRPAAALILALSLAGCASFQGGPAEVDPEAPHVEAGGRRILARTVGEGRDVVLLHGFASSQVVWEGLEAGLCRSRRCTLLDLPGFGRSEKRAGEYSPEALAEVVLALMERQGVGQADLVAHSWGCSVALALARAHPERVRRLVLVSAWVYADQLPTFFLWSRAGGVGEFLFDAFYRQGVDDRLALGFHDPDRFVTQELVDAVEAAMERPGAVRAALQAVRDMRLERLEGGYPEIDREALVLWGAEDQVSRLEFGERLVGELPRARLATIPDCGHLPMVECPGPFEARVLDFLGSEAAEAAE